MVDHTTTLAHVEPCPFCGNDYYPVRTNGRMYSDAAGNRWEQQDYYLECVHCEYTIGKGEPNSYGDYHCQFKTAADALAFWNNRPTKKG